MKKIAITEIAKDIAQELLSMENRQRKLKGDRFNALLASVETLIKDSVSIRFLRSRYNWASISKRPGNYSSSLYNKSLSYRVHVKLAYEGMRALGYLTEEKRGVSDGPIGRYRTKYSATPKLLRKFDGFDRATLPVVCGAAQVGELIRVQVSETVGTKDGSRPQIRKKLIEYKNTPEVDVLRSNLERINKAIASRWIDLELSDDGFVAMQAQMRSRKDRNSEDGRQLNLTKTQLTEFLMTLSLKRGAAFMEAGGKIYQSNFAV